MNIKRTTTFLLDKEKGKPDSKLRYRIKWNGNTVAFNIGYRVDNNKWVAEAQRCKVNTTHGKKKVPASTINAEINRFEELINDAFFFFEQTEHIPSTDEFRNEVNRRNGRIVEKKKKPSSITICNSLRSRVKKTAGPRIHIRGTKPQ